MKLEIKSTNKITHIDGIPVRLWEGQTEKGINCLVFVHRIAVNKDEDSEEFDRTLKEQLQPGQVIPLRNIL